MAAPVTDSLGRFTEIEFDLNWVKGKSTVQENDCWNWNGFVSPTDGYGRYRRPKRNWTAHRFVFNLINGYEPKVVMHKCDNRICVNPDHLEGGTQKKNLQDMIDRGRGKGQFEQKISDRDKMEIKDLALHGAMSQILIAKLYGIKQSTVSYIKSGKDTNRRRFKG